MKHYCLTLLAALCCALLAACGPSNTVMLAAPAEISPANTAQPGIALVRFEDQRGKNTLGVRADKSHFFAADPVDEWFSKTLADGLNRAGMHVIYVRSVAEAVHHNPAYILTGSLDELWITESSRTNMSARIRAHFTLAHGDQNVSREMVRTERESTNVLFSSSAASTLIDSTMSDFCDVMVEKIRRAVK
ncbi:MAG: hypothetical protein PUB01_02445 [Desulfovibrionaceae bacterium]|nr:hypothetical protein [Desulfovibrionaceae bacterium]